MGEVEPHEYSEINDLLKSLRETRLRASRSVSQRVFSMDGIQVMDEFMGWYLVRKFKEAGLRNKRVATLESGCALPGIVCSMLGANVILGEKKDLHHLLHKTVNANPVPVDSIDYCEFEWNQPCPKIEARFNDFVLTTAPLEWNNPEQMDKVLNSFVHLSGNGTRLLWGYIKPSDEIHNDIRAKLDKHFDMKMSRQAIFYANTCEIIILQAVRRPFSSFLEKFLTYGMGATSTHQSTTQIVSTPAPPRAQSPPLSFPTDADDDEAELLELQLPERPPSRPTLSSLTITSPK